MNPIIAKLGQGEIVYLSDSCDTDAVFKVMGEKTKVKFKGKEEYEVDTSTAIVTNAMHCGKMISQKEYDNF